MLQKKSSLKPAKPVRPAQSDKVQPVYVPKSHLDKGKEKVADSKNKLLLKDNLLGSLVIHDSGNVLLSKEITGNSAKSNKEKVQLNVNSTMFGFTGLASSSAMYLLAAG